MPTILINECLQEVSTFNPVQSHLGQFYETEGVTFLEKHKKISSEVQGAMSVFEQCDYKLLGGYSARMMSSGGVLKQHDFDHIQKQFLAPILEHHENCDAFYFSLHGAMQAETCDDPEGFLLKQAVEIIGKEKPIIISLDLHGILTEKMLQNIWAFSVLHTYPHVDFVENGERAAELLIHCLKTQRRPILLDIPIPALVRGDELITETGIYGKLIQQTIDLVEQNVEVLAGGVMIGNPFTDVPELKSHVLLTLDNDQKQAELSKACQKIAAQFWENKHLMQAELFRMSDAFEFYQQVGGPVILADAADATSSGASGDSNVILKAIVDYDASIPSLVPILDAPAALLAKEAGVGNQLTLQLGGACDKKRFKPITLSVEVLHINEDPIPNVSHGGVYDAGLTAVVGYKKIEIVIFSQPIHLFDPSIFTGNGCDPKEFDFIVVKSPHTQYHFFSAWSKKTFVLDVPGSTSANLPSLGHVNCQRPIYPLDFIQSFIPQTKGYS